MYKTVKMVLSADQEECYGWYEVGVLSVILRGCVTMDEQYRTSHHCRAHPVMAEIVK